jgi:hypothetical protein
MTHMAQLLMEEMEVLRQPLQAEMSMSPEVGEGTPPASMRDGSSPVSSADSTSSTIPSQLREVATKFLQAVNSNDNSAFFKIMSSLDQFQVVRMFLTSKAWLSQINHELLSTHEIHLLYMERERLEIVGPEYEIIMRTIIGDRFSLISGWYWFSDLKFLDMTAYLYSTAVDDPLQKSAHMP